MHSCFRHAETEFGATGRTFGGEAGAVGGSTSSVESGKFGGSIVDPKKTVKFSEYSNEGAAGGGGLLNPNHL